MVALVILAENLCDVPNGMNTHHKMIIKLPNKIKTEKMEKRENKLEGQLEENPFSTP